MPVTYTFDDPLVVVTGGGDAEIQDFLDCFDRAAGDPRFRPGMKLLVLDEGSAVDPGPHAEKFAADLATVLVGRYTPRMAVVVQKPVHYGIGRMLMVHGERYGLRFHVFLDEEEARTWLLSDDPPASGDPVEHRSVADEGG